MELKEIAKDVYACLQDDRGLGWNNAGFVNLGGGLAIDTFYDLNLTGVISFPPGMKQFVMALNAAELYVYVETYSPNKVLSLKKRFDLKMGSEGRLDNTEKNKEKSELSEELNLSYFL